MGRKIILNVAISLDGFIADEDGGYEWIAGQGDTEADTNKAFDFVEFMDNIDVVIMGRKAYEDCDIKAYSEKRVLVASSANLGDHDNVEFIHEDICGFAQTLRQGEGKDIWIFGGGVLADSFIKADMIDEYVIGIIPVILGKGKPLFLEGNPRIKLHLDECTVQDGIVILRFSKG